MTLARWTQPSGPLCLWQCFCWWSKYGRNFCNFTFSPQKLQHLLLRNGLVATWNRNKDEWKSSHIMGNVCTSQSYFLQDILQLFLGLRQVIFPQMHIGTSAGLSQHSWGIGSLTLKTKRFNFFSEISRFFHSTCLCSFVGEAWSTGGHGRGGGVRGVSNEGLNTWSWKLYLKSIAFHRI